MTSKTLQPPTPQMLTDSNAMYKFFLEIWNRSGGYQASNPDLTGLTASVPELNTLNGIRLDESVQNQLDNKVSVGTLGTMAIQDANAVAISGGNISGVTINNSTGALLNISNSNISNSTITYPTGSAIIAQAGGTIDVNTTTAGNSGAAETTLLSFSLLANTLNIDSNYIEITGFGTFAANANNKQIKLKLGSTTIYDTTALAMNDGSWKIVCTIIRIGATAQKNIAEVSSSNALLTNSAVYSVSAENLGTTLNILFTGTGIADNDIVQEGLIVKYFNG